MVAQMTARGSVLSGVVGLALVCSSCIQVLHVELHNAAGLNLRITPSVGEPVLLAPEAAGVFEYHLKLVVDSQRQRWIYEMPASLATSFSPAFIEQRDRGGRFVRMSISGEGVITVLVPGAGQKPRPCPTQPAGFPLKPVAIEPLKMSP